MSASRPAYLFENPEEYQPNVSLMIGADKLRGLKSPMTAYSKTVSATPSTGGTIDTALPDMFLGSYPVVSADEDGASECMFRSR